MLRFLRILLLAVVILFSGCAPLLQPVTSSGTAPSPVVSMGPRGEDNPNIFVDNQPFQAALVEALNARDTERLKLWMNEPFMTGWWRGERLMDPPADALRNMLNEYLGDKNQLAVVANADLYNLMGEKSPISLAWPEASVESAFLVSGWGKAGRDEMIMLIARRPDNSLRWQGAILVQGGFTAQQMGGVKVFTNPAHGYRLYIPKGFEAQQASASEVVFLAPGDGHRERGFISVEPANGRTAAEAMDEFKAETGQEQVPVTAIVAGIEGSPALVIDNLPGQDINRRLFTVHNDVLYQMMFMPADEAAGEANQQMENLYGTILNTFHFLPGQGGIAPLPVTDVEQFETQLRKALAARDMKAVRALMSDNFSMAFWQSEGMNIAPAEAAEQIVVRFVPPEAQLGFDNQKDFNSLFQGQTPVVVTAAGDETILPVYVSGWGLQGKDEAVMYFARRIDGSLYWKGILTAQGGFPRPVVSGQPFEGIPVQGTTVQSVTARAYLNIRRGPGTGYDVLGKLEQGQTVNVTGASVDGGWWRVLCPDGRIGNCWISADPALSQPSAGN